MARYSAVRPRPWSRAREGSVLAVDQVGPLDSMLTSAHPGAVAGRQLRQETPRRRIRQRLPVDVHACDRLAEQHVAQPVLAIRPWRAPLGHGGVELDQLALERFLVRRPS